MAKQHRTRYKDLGLEIALILGRYFFHTDYLHYGYWTKGLAVEPDNLLCAQQNYCDLLLAHIPPDTKTILDVGCGTGKFAQELQKRGYQVDCVSPSALLTGHARRRLGEESTIFECRFEELETTNRYDLILFSESFQYVPMDQAFTNATRFLTASGHLLICDFFGLSGKGVSPLRGGHSLCAFYEQLAQYPFALLEDCDITEETAPNLDLIRDLLEKVVLPVGRSLNAMLRQNHPFLLRSVAWLYRKRIAKIKSKYTGNSRTSATFSCFKSYRLLLCRHTSTLGLTP